MTRPALLASGDAAVMAPVIIRPWPRLLDEREAATYLGIGTSKFRDGYTATPPRYPAPIRDGGRVLWDIKALDAHVDAIAGIVAPLPQAAGARNTWDAS